MMDRAESERLMLTRETGYIEELKDSCGPLSAEILGVMSGLYRAGWTDCWEAEAVHAWNERLDRLAETSKPQELSFLRALGVDARGPRVNLTHGDAGSWLETIWSALHGYRQDCIPEGDPAYDDEWSDITTAMAWIEETMLDAEKTS